MAATKVAILGGSVTEWQRRALVNAERRADVEYTLVVEAASRGMTEATQTRTKFQILQSWLRSHRWWTLIKLDRYIRNRLFGPSEYDRLFETCDVDDVDVLRDADRIEFDPISDGAWNEIPPERVEAIAERSDVAIRFGFGLLRGKILSALDYGVLSFHPADIRRYRGQGPEQTFVNGDTTAGATLQRLGEGIDDGRIVAVDSVDVSDCHTLDGVEVRVRRLMTELLPRGLNSLSDPAFEPQRPDRLGEYHSLADRNSFPFALTVLYRNARGRLERRLRR